MMSFEMAERFANVMSSKEYFNIVDQDICPQCGSEWSNHDNDADGDLRHPAGAIARLIAREEDEYADAHEEPDPDVDLDDALRGKW